MKRINKSLAFCMTASALFFSLSAQADPGPYVELGYVWPKISGYGIGVTAGDAAVRVGYMVNANFGLEAIGATSVNSGSISGIDIKLKDVYGAYLKGQLDVSHGFELFAKVGWIHATLEASGFGDSASSSDSGFSYGAGAQYHFNDKWYGQVDYMSYYDKDGSKIYGPSISVGYRF